jgi:superfamily II DNA or RNA helicase
MNFVDYSMFIIYSTRPIPREGVLERFRLTDAIKRVSLNVFDEGVDSIEHFIDCLLPV